jgi:erythromycin esterase-like protein
VAGQSDLDAMADAIADARVVMLGEATHGTTQFYDWRRRISQRLIERHGFGFIAVEGDWPDCGKIDDFVCGRDVRDVDDDDDPRAVLSSFDRWPTWMWANEEVVRLMTWMRGVNQSRLDQDKARFHGLDVYSLYRSIDAVLRYLETVEPELAQTAAQRYACFGAYEGDEIAYARSTMSLPEGCADEAVQTMVDLLSLNARSGSADDELFDAQQNARIVHNAERYYRTMLHGDAQSWNIRDQHMLETLELLVKRGGSSGEQPRRGIVWAHNTHIGDYRATDMAAAGYVNLGGLARERFGRDEVELVGFSTRAGTVTAAFAWDASAQAMPVPPAKQGSYEHALHVAGEEIGPDLALLFDDAARGGPLASVAGQRAIGVVYDPAEEPRRNYVPTSLAERYDAFAFVHDSSALTPLPTKLDPREIPETWPSGV